MTSLLSRKWASYVLAVVGVAVVTAVLIPLNQSINATTVGFAFLLLVVFVAIFWGSKPALLASIVSMFCFNFFFLPPLYTLTIADPQNWVALTAYFITALAVGQLSARARRRAEEAEAGRVENRRLYEELKDTFEIRSQAEALKRSEQFKTALLDAVTHDLRTPLTSIKASSTILIDDRQDRGEPLSAGEKDALLEVINQEADRLDRFVESIVDLARIEAGEIELRRNWGPVDEIVDAAVARAEPLLQQHQLRIKIEQELPIVRVDPRAVAEVIFTLLDNATKYSPPKSSITIQAERADGEVIKISVEDDGPGIPVGSRERVFDKFFRDSARDADGHAEGIGIGLSIAKGIVEAHAGRIWIEDGERGRGTRVSFTVPVGDDEVPPREVIDSEGVVN
jgi:two-component system sensor histidine kinase KdpD